MHADLVLFQAERLGDVLVEDVIDDLHFEEVVAASRACRTARLPRLTAWSETSSGSAAVDAAVGFGVLEVARRRRARGR